MFDSNKFYFCAHVLVSVRHKEPISGDKTLYLYESLLLICCKDEGEDPWIMAEETARKKYIGKGDSETFLDGRPSYHQFEGIRKVVAVDVDEDCPELSYLQLEIPDEDALDLLLSRKPVGITCYDDQVED